MSLSKSSKRVKRDTDDNDDECVYQRNGEELFTAKALKWHAILHYPSIFRIFEAVLLS